MNEISLKAYAKLNLSLDVCGRLDNGYHEVDMLMVTCDLCDEIIIKKADSIVLNCNIKTLSCGEDNIMVKAARLFFDYTKINAGCEIKLEKRIPIAAGMAGGSTDAAAVLKGLNKLYNTKLTIDELCDLGVKLGADVPYCIHSKTMRSQGIGEKLEYIGEIKNAYVVLVKTKQGLSTAEIYKAVDEHQNLVKPDTELLINCIKEGNIKGLAKNMCNVMEQVSIKKIPEISKIKESLKELGAMGVLMSGSGPTVFGIFESREKADYVAENIDNNDYFVYSGKIL